MAGSVFVQLTVEEAKSRRQMLARKACDCEMFSGHRGNCPAAEILSKEYTSYLVKEFQWHCKRQISEIDITAESAIRDCCPMLAIGFGSELTVVEVQASGNELDYIKAFMTGLTFCPSMEVNFFYGDQARSIYAHLLS